MFQYTWKREVKWIRGPRYTGSEDKGICKRMNHAENEGGNIDNAKSGRFEFDELCNLLSLRLLSREDETHRRQRQSSTICYHTLSFECKYPDYTEMYPESLSALATTVTRCLSIAFN